MHTGKDPLNQRPQFLINRRCPADADTRADIALYHRTDTFIRTAVAAAHTKHDRVKYKGVVYQCPCSLLGVSVSRTAPHAARLLCRCRLPFPARISSMQHVGRHKQKFPLFRLQFPAAADKLPPALPYMNQFKLTVPVHRHIRKPFRQPALIIAVGNPCGAVLSLFLRLPVRHSPATFLSVFCHHLPPGAILSLHFANMIQ